MSYTGEAAKLAAELDREAAAKRAQERAAAQARRAEDDARRQASRPENSSPQRVSRVSRANYSRIQNGMNVDEVQDILGPGKELSSGEGITIATWSSATSFCEITITFEDGRVANKVIVGD